MAGKQDESKRGNPFLQEMAESVIRFRWLMILVPIVVAVLIGSGVRYLGFGSNYRLFFSGENPELTAFEDFQDTYTKTDNILFVVKPKDGSKVFTPETAPAIEELTAAAWTIPYAIRVDSVSNFQHSWAEGDDLTVEDLLEDAGTLTGDELATKEAVALAEPLLKGNLLSVDGDTTGVNVTFQYPEKSITEVPEAAAKARAIVDELGAKYPGLEIVPTGLSMMNAAFAEASQKDLGSLVPLMFGVILLVTALTVRSVAGTAITFAVILFSTAAALGAGGFFNYKLLPISFTVVFVVPTLAIADSIHILVTFRKAMAGGLGKIDAIKESLRVNFVPVSITSLTTIIGFMALNFSDSPPFWHLGNMTAVGVAIAWMFSITFLPALLSLLPVRVKARSGEGVERRSLMTRYADFLIARRKAVLLGAGLTSLLLAFFAPRNELNDEWVKYFDHRVPFRHAAEFGMEHLTGIYLLDYSVGAEGADGISDPAYLAKLEEFTDWLRSQPEVVHVYSYTDIIKRLNKNMHGDDDTWYRLPENRELAAQYHLLYELSLPFGLDMNDRVSIDKSASRVTATLPEISTARVREFMERSKGWFVENAPEYMHAMPTGPTAMFSLISKRNVESMLTGNAVAVGLIALVMMVALRSVGIGLFSLIPNALPILITFGVWALLVGTVGLAAATVAATSLGIVVDDTVHFLAKFLYARRQKGLDKQGAVRYAFETVGVAILTTTLILVLGFAVLAYSTFLINSQMGMLTAIAIFAAFVFDFTVLPALLLIDFRKKTEPESATEQSDEQETSIPALA